MALQIVWDALVGLAQQQKNLPRLLEALHTHAHPWSVRLSSSTSAIISNRERGSTSDYTATFHDAMPILVINYTVILASTPQDGSYSASFCIFAAARPH